MNEKSTKFWKECGIFSFYLIINIPMSGKYPIIFALITVFLVAGCKKGEEDPSISLRSRAKRLEGDWRLVSGNASYTTDGYNETYVFTGTKVKLTTTLYYPVEGIYLLGLKIKKAGTFTLKEYLLGAKLEASGTWNFNTGVGETKKKEEVIFTIDDVQMGYTGYNIFNRNSTHFVYKIKELRDKKLVINSAGKIYSESKGRYATFSTDYIFQQ